MKLQVLVSTMNQKDYSLIDRMNIQTSAIVINQCNYKIINDTSKKDINWRNSYTSGLSRSRNIALKNSECDICLIADDDLIYVNNYNEIVIEQFNKHTNADIITFQVEGIESELKKYYSCTRRINYINSMKVCSVEIAFRRDSILNKGIVFDEHFGAGTKHLMSEENIFLYDCLKEKLNIIYVPIKIADIHIGESSWFKGYSKEYFIAKGAAFARMTKNFSKLLIIQYAFRKNKLYKYKISKFQLIKLMIKGRNLYLDKVHTRS